MNGKIETEGGKVQLRSLAKRTVLFWAITLIYSALLLSGETLEICKIENRDRFLWNQTVLSYFQDRLWINTNIYEAAHVLMVPMHAAFYFGEEPWLRDFSELFQKFTNSDPVEVEKAQLKRLQWSYLCTRFCVLAQLSGRTNLIPQGFREGEEAVLTNEWSPPGSQWNLRLSTIWRLKWRAEHWNESPSYTALFSDNDFFAFACAAELAHFRSVSGLPNSPVLDDILTFAYRVLEQEGRFQSDGGWIFEPGAWTDHPEYAYAGRTEKAPGMEPLKVPGIAPDSSHSHRFPLWIQSLLKAYPVGSTEHLFVARVHWALEHQFFTKVFVEPSPDFSAARTHNFMDGWNGIYRWGYGTIGPANGYGPYEVSGTFTLGWWAFLGTERARNNYRQLASAFPLSPSVLTLYQGPVDQGYSQIHPLVRWPNYFTNGFGELVVSLASKLPPVWLPPLSNGGLRLRSEHGRVLLQLAATPTETFYLDESTDLISWSPIPFSATTPTEITELILKPGQSPMQFFRIGKRQIETPPSRGNTGEFLEF